MKWNQVRLSVLLRFRVLVSSFVFFFPSLLAVDSVGLSFCLSANLVGRDNTRSQQNVPSVSTLLVDLTPAPVGSQIERQLSIIAAMLNGKALQRKHTVKDGRAMGSHAYHCCRGQKDCENEAE